jgi:hypothetical protein
MNDANGHNRLNLNDVPRSAVRVLPEEHLNRRVERTVPHLLEERGLIFTIKHKSTSDAFRLAFNVAWQTTASVSRVAPA